MLDIDKSLKCSDLTEKIDHLWTLSGQKILSIENNYDHTKGAPVFTSAGKYTTRGWTEWTQGLNMDLQHYSLRQPKMNNFSK